MEMITLKNGSKISESQLLEFVETEMSEGCHMDYIEDYETPLDFYLSNVDEDSYVSHYLRECLPEVNKDDLEEVQLLVRNIIIERS